MNTLYIKLISTQVVVEVEVGVKLGNWMKIDATLSFRHSLDGVQVLFRGVVGWVAGEMGIKANLNSSCS